MNYHCNILTEFMSERVVSAVILVIELTAGAQGYHEKGLDVLRPTPSMLCLIIANLRPMLELHLTIIIEVLVGL